MEEDRKADEEKQAEYSKEWDQWKRRQDAKKICAKGLPQCPNHYLQIGDNFKLGLEVVWAADRDVGVVVNEEDEYHPKPICYFTKAQEAAENRRDERIHGSWLAECRRKPHHVFHTEPIGLGCSKIVDECGDKSGTLCSSDSE
jgi:hypothetical protein